MRFLHLIRNYLNRTWSETYRPRRTPLSSESTRSVEDAAGNQAVQRLLHDGWQVGAADNRQEQEARRAAFQIAAQNHGQPMDTMHRMEAAVSGGPTSPLSGPGHPLTPATRSHFESRLGTDLKAVRLHTDSSSQALAKALGARAFTAGNDIAFAAGQYDHHTSAGKHLLGHELVHVLQQRRAGSASAQSPTGLIQRTPDGQTPAEPQPQPITAATASSWRQRVDAAVRAYFNLSGPGLTAARVSFVPEAQFAGRIPAATIPELLLDLFLSPPPRTRIHDILRHHRMALSGPRRLRQFIADRIQIGYFEYSFVVPGQPGRVLRKITPAALIAEIVGGVTNTQGARYARRVVMPVPSNVETLVHEACHFYVHSNFRNAADASQHRDEFIFGFRRPHLLNEGFAEHFARQVMAANRAVFGPVTIHAYQPEVEAVWRLVVTMTEQAARAAYFQGNASAISRLQQAITLNRQTHPDLLVPSFMIP